MPRSQCIDLGFFFFDHWKWFLMHSYFPLCRPIIMKPQKQTPPPPPRWVNRSRMCPIDFWVKGSRSQCIDYRNGFHLSISQGCTPQLYRILCQKSRSNLGSFERVVTVLYWVYLYWYLSHSPFMTKWPWPWSCWILEWSSQDYTFCF